MNKKASGRINIKKNLILLTIIVLIVFWLMPRNTTAILIDYSIIAKGDDHTSIGDIVEKYKTPFYFSWSEKSTYKLDRSYERCDYRGILFYPIPQIRYVAVKNCYMLDVPPKGSMIYL